MSRYPIKGTMFKGWRVIPPDADFPEAFRWTRTSGPALSIACKGPFNEMYNLGQTLTEDFDSIEIVREGEGTMYRLTAAQNGDEIQEVHEVSGSHFTQPVRSNLRIRNNFTSYGVLEVDQVIASTLTHVTNVQNGKTKYDKAILLIDDVLSETGVMAVGGNTSAAGQLIRELFDHYLTYGDNFLQVQYTYRHTLIFAERIFKNYDTDAIYENVEKIHTETQLRNAEQIPTNFYLPKQVTDNTKTAQWLKQAPSVALTYGQKRSLAIDYLFADEISTMLYANSNV